MKNTKDKITYAPRHKAIAKKYINFYKKNREKLIKIFGDDLNKYFTGRLENKRSNIEAALDKLIKIDKYAR